MMAWQNSKCTPCKFKSLPFSLNGNFDFLKKIRPAKTVKISTFYSIMSRKIWRISRKVTTG